VSEELPKERPHGDPMRPHLPTGDDRPADEEQSPSDLPAPEPVDGPDRGGDEDPGAGAD
jgi:hypothetical protein